MRGRTTRSSGPILVPALRAATAVGRSTRPLAGPANMLIWNKADFIECLETTPTFDDTYDPYYLFTVTKHGLRLEITLYEDAGDVYISLFQENSTSAFLKFTLLQCSGARFVRTHGKEYLEFAPARLFEQRYDGESLIPAGIRITVNPNILVENYV